MSSDERQMSPELFEEITHGLEHLVTHLLSNNTDPPAKEDRIDALLAILKSLLDFQVDPATFVWNPDNLPHLLYIVRMMIAAERERLAGRDLPH